MPVDVGIMPILDQAATINMALSRNGCVMERELARLISKYWLFPNPFAAKDAEGKPFDMFYDAEGKRFQGSRNRVHNQADRCLPCTGCRRNPSVCTEQVAGCIPHHQRVRNAYTDLIA